MLKNLLALITLSCMMIVNSAIGEAKTISIYKKLKPANPIPVKSVAFCEFDGTYHFIFNLKANTSKEFAVNCIYIYADDNPKTGRKDLGNDYYIVPSKTKLTFYGNPGLSFSAYKAVATSRIGNMLFISSKANRFAEKPLVNFKLTIATTKGKIYVTVSPENIISTFTLPSLPQLREGPSEAVLKQLKAQAFLDVSRPGTKSPPAVAAWIEDSAFRIKNQNDYTGNKELAIIAARNEKIDFQVGVWVKNRSRGEIKLSHTNFVDLKGAEISKRQVRLYRIKSLLFMEPVDQSKKYKIKLYGNLKFYKHSIRDRLEPYAPGTPTGSYKGFLNKSFNTFWGTIHVPIAAVAGTYKGMVKVESPGKNFNFPLTIKVLDFTIPEKPSFTMFAAMPRNVNYHSTIFNQVISGGFPSGITLNYEKCLRNFAEHRVALRAMSVGPTLTFNKNGDPQLDFTRFDKLTQYILDDLKMNPKLALPFAGVSWGHGSAYTKAFGPIGYDFMSEEFKTKYVKTLNLVGKHLKERGWMDAFLAYFSDEPTKEQVEQTRAIAKLIKKADSDFIPWFYGGGPNKEYMDVINTWQLGYGAPLEDGEGTYTPKEWKEAMARGDRIGIYNPWEAYLMNVPPAYTRTLYWWAYKQKLFWMSMYCVGYFNNYGPTPTNAGYWKLWVYPPTARSSGGVWFNSIRWEMTRKGLEDYEYLKGVETIMGKILKELPAEVGELIDSTSISMEYATAVAKSSSKHLADGSRLLVIKNALADELDALRSEPVAAAHYSFKNCEIELWIFGKPGVTAEFNGKSHTIPESGIKTLTLSKDKFGGKSLKIKFALDGKSKIITKHFFKPFNNN